MQPTELEQEKNQTRNLTPFVETLETGDPIGHANLTLVPLRGGGHEQLDYILAGDAIAAGQLRITETSEQGSVPELLAVCDADFPVLLLDGEELVGAKQNRVLNTSVLLRRKSRTRIPVSCVEQGRWQDLSEEFASGSYSPAGLRARKSRDVGRNLRTLHQARSDQGAVWDEVASSVRNLAACSPTMAMHDAVEQRRDWLEAYVEALAFPRDTRGVVAAINGRFVALDLLDKPATLERIWSRLITGYAMDAIAARTGDEKSATRVFSAKGACALLEHVGQVPCQPCPSVGLGEDWRFEAQDVVGQALVAEQTCVHLSAFPNDQPGRDRQEGSTILPPSRRRLSRRGQAQHPPQPPAQDGEIP